MKKIIITTCIAIGMAGCASHTPQENHNVVGELIKGERCSPGSFSNSFYFRYCPPIQIQSSDGTIYQVKAFVDADMGDTVSVRCSKGPVCDKYAYRK